VLSGGGLAGTRCSQVAGPGAHGVLSDGGSKSTRCAFRWPAHGAHRSHRSAEMGAHGLLSGGGLAGTRCSQIAGPGAHGVLSDGGSKSTRCAPRRPAHGAHRSHRSAEMGAHGVLSGGGPTRTRCALRWRSHAHTVCSQVAGLRAHGVLRDAWPGSTPCARRWVGGGREFWRRDGVGLDGRLCAGGRAAALGPQARPRCSSGTAWTFVDGSDRTSKGGVPLAPWSRRGCRRSASRPGPDDPGRIRGDSGPG
jgi:hypothetical protein